MRVIHIPPDGRCGFCGKAILPEYGLSGKKEIKEFVQKYGEGRKFKRSLGRMPVCVSCCEDIKAMIKEEE